MPSTLLHLLSSILPNVKDVVSIGDTVTVKITAIDEEKKRISLSIRAVGEDAAEEEAEEAPVEAAEEVVYSDEAPVEAPAEAPAEEAAE